MSDTQAGVYIAVASIAGGPHKLLGATAPPPGYDHHDQQQRHGHVLLGLSDDVDCAVVEVKINNPPDTPLHVRYSLVSRDYTLIVLG